MAFTIKNDPRVSILEPVSMCTYKSVFLGRCKLNIHIYVYKYTWVHIYICVYVYIFISMCSFKDSAKLPFQRIYVKSPTHAPTNTAWKCLLFHTKTNTWDHRTLNVCQAIITLHFSRAFLWWWVSLSTSWVIFLQKGSEKNEGRMTELCHVLCRASAFLGEERAVGPFDLEILERRGSWDYTLIRNSPGGHKGGWAGPLSV